MKVAMPLRFPGFQYPNRQLLPSSLSLTHPAPALSPKNSSLMSGFTQTINSQPW